MNEIIKVKQVKKQVGTTDIIKNISFSVKEGEIVGLLGPNGSGKTTMIRLLNGVIKPTEGTMEVLGKSVEEHGEYIRKSSGIVTENTHLYHEMSALENLSFFASIYGVREEGRIEELLKDFGMWEKRGDKLGSFSTGMKKRIALCKALLPRPKLLFLDEPTNGLDPEGIQFVFYYLKKLREKEKVTIVICTHVLQQLDEFCDSYLFLKQGEVIERGTKQDIEEKYLTDYQVRVRTGVQVEAEVFEGFPCKKEGDGTYVFSLKKKEDISFLLRKLLDYSWVEEVNVINNGLETLYFLVGGERIE